MVWCMVILVVLLHFSQYDRQTQLQIYKYMHVSIYYRKKSDVNPFQFLEASQKIQNILIQFYPLILTAMILF